MQRNEPFLPLKLAPPWRQPPEALLDYCIHFCVDGNVKRNGGYFRESLSGLRQRGWPWLGSFRVWAWNGSRSSGFRFALFFFGLPSFSESLHATIFELFGWFRRGVVRSEKKQPKHKVLGGIFLGHPGPRRRDIPNQDFMQKAFFCCFRQGVAGMSRDLGRDVPDFGKTLCKKTLGWFFVP